MTCKLNNQDRGAVGNLIRPMLRCCFLFLLLTPASALAQGCETSAACVPADATAATQPNSTLLWFGLAFDDPTAEISDTVRINYDPARAKFPTLEACVDGPSSPDSLATSGLAWARYETDAERSVCTFRYFAGFSSLEAIADWMLAEGFTVEPARLDANPNRFGAYRDAPIYTMNGSLVARGPNLLGSPADLASPKDTPLSVNYVWISYSPTYGVLQVTVRLRGPWEK